MFSSFTCLSWVISHYCWSERLDAWIAQICQIQNPTSLTTVANQMISWQFNIYRVLTLNVQHTTRSREAKRHYSWQWDYELTFVNKYKRPKHEVWEQTSETWTVLIKVVSRESHLTKTVTKELYWKVFAFISKIKYYNRTFTCIYKKMQQLNL